FVAKVKGPFALRLRSSPPLSCSTSVPDDPTTLPPIEYVAWGEPAPAPTQLSAFAGPKVMIPGAPPVTVVSVAVICATPFCRNEIVEPTAVSLSCVPAARAPELTELPSWIQLPALRSYRRNCCVPLFQK